MASCITPAWASYAPQFRLTVNVSSNAAATAEYCQWQKEGKQFKIGAIVNPDEN